VAERHLRRRKGSAEKPQEPGKGRGLLESYSSSVFHITRAIAAIFLARETLARLGLVPAANQRWYAALSGSSGCWVITVVAAPLKMAFR